MRSEALLLSKTILFVQLAMPRGAVDKGPAEIQTPTTLIVIPIFHSPFMPVLEQSAIVHGGVFGEISSESTSIRSLILHSEFNLSEKLRVSFFLKDCTCP